MTFWHWLGLVFLVTTQILLVTSARGSAKRAELAASRCRRALRTISELSHQRDQLVFKLLEYTQPDFSQEVRRREKLKDSQTTRLLPIVTTQNGGRHRSAEEVQEAVTELLPKIEE